MQTNNKLRIYKEAVAIITGGASGIGRALAVELAQRGAAVVLADRQIELAHQVVQQIEAGGATARAVEVDVTDFLAVKKAVDQTIQEFGRLDYFFNNAGIGIGGEAVLYSLDDWNDVIGVNLHGVIHGVQAAYPVMIEQGFGHIVNTASMAGFLPGPGMVSYNTTKHAVVGLSVSLRLEAARHGVRVSALCPGVIRTPILQGGRFGKSLRQIPPEMVKEFWEKMRPMEPQLFARKALNALAKNKAIIIYPRWWRLYWWLCRLSPALVMRLFQRRHEAYMKKIEEHLKKAKQEKETAPV